MKGQRKEVNTANTHIAIRLKKGGAGKGQTRFEVLINRSAYPGAAQAKKKDYNWDMKEIVDEIFTNSAKLEPADKNILDQCFPNKTKKEIILEILEKGETQTSEVDRVQESAAQNEYFSQVAAAVASAALIKEEVVIEGKSAAALAEAARSQQDDEPSGKKSKKGGGAKAEKTAEPAHADPTPAPVKGKGAGAASAGEPRYIHVGKDVVEREMKNARFKLIPGGADKVSLDEQVNAAFLALSKNAATIKIIRDQHIMVIDCEKQQDAQEALKTMEDLAGKKPWKVLKQVTDKKGNQTLTILFAAGIKMTGFTSKPGITVNVQNTTHIPSSEEDDLTRYIPANNKAASAASSAPAAASSAKTDKKQQNDNDDDKKGTGKKGGKKGGKNAAEAVSAKGKGGTGSASLEDELAGLLKKAKGDSSSSDDESSEDEAPKMMVNKKKRR